MVKKNKAEKINSKHVAERKNKVSLESVTSEEVLTKIREYPSVVLKEIQMALDHPSKGMTPQEIFKVKDNFRKKVKDLKRAIKKWVTSYEKQ